MPSRLGLLLNMTAKSLERVLYYEQYIVTDPGSTPLEEKQLFQTKNLGKLKMNSASLKQKWVPKQLDVLARINLEEELKELYDQMHETKSKQIVRNSLTGYVRFYTIWCVARVDDIGFCACYSS